MTYAELFAGAGGLSLGLDAAGFHALAHAEWDHHARAVLRYRWPDTRLDGDVTEINGADYAGITLLSGGSPCQDLSVAGKRAGLTGSRSSLFHEQCRIWRESGAPYLLWENVLGALSSNNGADFATVLSTIVGSTVAVPADGWRGGGGVVAGRDAVAAWRVLDLQHVSGREVPAPPQRRVRVFVLAARAGGVDPAEVLALSEGVCGHPSPRQQSREGVAARARGGAEGGVTAFAQNQRGELRTSEVAPQLTTGGGKPGEGYGAVLAWDNELNASTEAHGPSMARGKSGGDRNGVISFTSTQTPKVGGDVLHTLEAASKSGGGQTPAVVAWDNAVALNISNGVPSLDDTMGTLDTNGASTTAIGAQTRGVVIGWDQELNAAEELMGTLHHTQTPISGEVSPAIGRPTDGMGVFVDPGMESWKAAEVIEPMCARDYKDAAAIVVGNRGMESWKTVDVAIGLAARDAKGANNDVIGTLDFGGHGGSYNGQDAYTGRILPSGGRPRRLTPLECERLMSWPDQWTATGRKDDGTEYALSDTARYRLCGNGVGSVCAEWIGRRLMAAITAQVAA
jgi:site-specific DNA-cytosine methylase